MQELEEFRKVEVGQLKTIINDVAKETVKELKATSPRRKGPQGGEYKKIGPTKSSVRIRLEAKW